MWSDVRITLRTLRKSPAFTVSAVLCLALGMGANTAIFSLADAALFRMLPVTAPEQLVALQVVNPRGPGPPNFSYPQYAFLRDHADALAGILAYATIDIHLSTDTTTESPTGLVVSHNYFSVLGVRPAIGRVFTPQEADAAVLSYGFWQRRFDADPAVVGRGVVLNGLPFTIVGVTPREFFGTEVGKSPDVYVPLESRDRLAASAAQLTRPNSFWLAVLARMRPDIPAPEAAARVNTVYQQANSEQAARMRPALLRSLQQQRLVFAPGSKGLRGIGTQFRTPLLTLMTVVSLVLLIACANVANLLLVRADARRREIAVRLALGAGRIRLLRQSLAESLVLTAAGGALGLLFALWGVRALTGVLTQYTLNVTLDGRILGFTVVASAITGLVFGAIPAARAMRTELTTTFRRDIASDMDQRRSRAGRVLVSSQVAISLLLLVGAGLFIRTLGNLRAIDHGFDGTDVLLATVKPGLSRYTPERANALFAELLGRVAALPGVRSASLADAPLLGVTVVDGLSVAGSSDSIAASVRVVAPRFFETMGIAVRFGRDFSAADRIGSPKVAIINETVARAFFRRQNPIGRRVGFGGADREIVGVIADTKYRSLHGTVPSTVYLPLAQFAYGTERTIHVRAWTDPAGLAHLIRQHVGALDKNLPVNVRLFSDLVDENLVQERLLARLSGFFGGLALLLTAIGLYGVITYAMQRRTREIGIRMALGAGRAAVGWMVARDCLLLLGLGVIAGLLASLWLSRLITQLLFGVAPHDPATFAGATALLIAVGIVAGYLPARRACRLDPTIALRCE